MAEELTFHQLRRNTVAVNGNERFISPWALGVNGTGQQLLACSTLTKNKNGSVTLGQPCRIVEQRLHHLALTHNAVKMFRCTRLLATLGQASVLQHPRSEERRVGTERR